MHWHDSPPDIKVLHRTAFHDDLKSVLAAIWHEMYPHRISALSWLLVRASHACLTEVEVNYDQARRNRHFHAPLMSDATIAPRSWNWVTFNDICTIFHGLRERVEFKWTNFVLQSLAYDLSFVSRGSLFLATITVLEVCVRSARICFRFYWAPLFIAIKSHTNLRASNGPSGFCSIHRPMTPCCVFQIVEAIFLLPNDLCRWLLNVSAKCDH